MFPPLPSNTSTTDSYATQRFSVLLEVTGSSPDLDKQRLERFLEMIYNIQLVEDAILSQDQIQEKVVKYLHIYIYSLLIFYVLIFTCRLSGPFESMFRYH
jgi:hypothetical protein